MDSLAARDWPDAVVVLTQSVGVEVEGNPQWGAFVLLSDLEGLPRARLVRRVHFDADAQRLADRLQLKVPAPLCTNNKNTERGKKRGCQWLLFCFFSVICSRLSHSFCFINVYERKAVCVCV